LLCVLCGAFCFGQNAVGAVQDGVTVEGEAFRGELVNVANGATTFRGAAKNSVAKGTSPKLERVAIEDVVRWGNPVDVRGRPVVVLSDGGRLATVADWTGGAAVRLDGESVVVLTDHFGEVRLPREFVRGVVFAQQRHIAEREKLIKTVQSPTASRRQSNADSDFVLMSNGDRVRGKVAAIDRGSLMIDTESGAAKLPLSRVEAVGLGGRQLSADGRQAHWTVGLRDGSLVYARDVVADEKRLKIVVDESLVLNGGAASDLVFMQALGGQVEYLSDLEAVDYRHVPYLSLEWPLGRDRNAYGGPLVVGGKRYLKGLGMHSASRVTYRLDGKYKRFDAAVAIDDSAEGRGSVTFGVYLMRDGTLSEAYKSEIVRGGDAPPMVSVDVAGAQGLTLVVDYADRGDEMDRADWLDARVMK
jgi:hypothetical protein